MNALGQTQIKYSYGAYGETVSTVIGWNNPITNPYRYNAERIDDVTGVPAFQYLRARYLNPYTSSFLTQDSYLGSLLTPLSQNRYTYAQNNPVNYTDPSGHVALTIFALLALGLLSGGKIVYDAAEMAQIDAEEDLKAAVEDYVEQESSLSVISNNYLYMHALSEQNGLEHDNYIETSWKEAFLNQLSATCDAYDEIKHQLDRIEDAEPWKKVGMGISVTGVGVGVAAAAPLLLEAASAISGGIVYVGTTADLIVAGGRVVGGMTVAYGVSTAAEGITGVNPLGETLYGGNYGAFYRDLGDLMSINMSILMLEAMGAIAQASQQNAILPSESTESEQPKSVRYTPANPGPLDEKIAKNFTGGSYTETVLTEDTVFYRVYGGNAEEVGRYMTRTPQNGGLQSQLDLALVPEWGNTAEYVTTVVVPAGTTIYEGTAASQIINGGVGTPYGGVGMLYGGGNQIFIPEVDPSWFIH